MNFALPLFGLLFAIGLLGGCGNRGSEAIEQQFIAFGTLVNVSIFGVDEALAQQGIAAVEKEFNQLHRDWHAWEPGPLVDLNRALAERGTAEVPAVLLPLLEPAQRLSEQTGGLFNPAMGKLIALWGFQSDEPLLAPPDKDAIAELVARHPSMADLHLDGTHLTTTNRAVQLDFGAFAKGVAIDRAIEQLQALGITNAIVNAGGDLRAIGRHGDRPWRIGIRNPRGPGVLAVIEPADDESIFTSGDYERGFDHNGHHYHHILDPRSGYPATGAISATVIHANAGVADAAATALMVAGAQDWVRIARELNLRHVMLIDSNGIVHMTPAMAKRVHIELEPSPPIELSEVL